MLLNICCLVATIWIIVANNKPQSRSSVEKIGPLLGKNIAARRKKLALTQEQVAERLGVEPITISRFECGSNLPSLQRLASLSEVLETSVAELLSQSVSNRSDQALMIEQWLLKLTPRERGFVVESVRQLSEHFAAASR
jgi:transcriptional regulator with XRE-family HTH domain